MSSVPFGSAGMTGRSETICLQVSKKHIPGISVSGSTFKSSCSLFLPAILLQGLPDMLPPVLHQILPQVLHQILHHVETQHLHQDKHQNLNQDIDQIKDKKKNQRVNRG